MQIRKTYRGEAEVFTEALNDILFILLMFFLIVATLANPNDRVIPKRSKPWWCPLMPTSSSMWAQHP